jgi:hypothetical protein
MKNNKQTQINVSNAFFFHAFNLGLATKSKTCKGVGQ